MLWQESRQEEFTTVFICVSTFLTFLQFDLDTSKLISKSEKQLILDYLLHFKFSRIMYMQIEAKQLNLLEWGQEQGTAGLGEADPAPGWHAAAAASGWADRNSYTHQEIAE